MKGKIASIYFRFEGKQKIWFEMKRKEKEKGRITSIASSSFTSSISSTSTHQQDKGSREEGCSRNCW
jgi:hypothetical protein